ncbi:TMEM175 family protein [Cryptosporangium sp. NPDC051539]|uniref:TMEM175 family protein n=1 Tax=Cryptosporangium sp. NPDC051539 TaxID=3363962 RepID=UPI0037ABF106
MRKERGLERFLTFLDAIVAIAVTLLILPLVELLDEVDQNASLRDLLDENRNKIWAFLLSFVVIVAFWRAHHSIFTHVARYDSWLGLFSLAWALTIVALPFPTQIIAVLDTSRATFGLYVGVMVANALLLAAMSLRISRTPGLRVPARDGDVPYSAVPALVHASLMVAALVIGLAVPSVGFFALLLLLFAGPVLRIRRRRSRPADTH